MSLGRFSGKTTVGRAVRSGALIVLPALFALMLTGCGGGDDPSPVAVDDLTDSTKTAGAVSLKEEWPLTGAPVDGELPDHPVYVVKIDNTSSSAPQLGLRQADMVVEELVEGGLTRLAAVFYSTLPGTVGPVRSMRASDIGVVSPINGVLVAAGGARPTRERIAQAGIDDLGEDDPGFERDNSRSAPYNLFAHLREIAHHQTRGWEPPAEPYFQFGDPDMTGAKTVTKIAAEFSGTHTTEWALQGGNWLRTNSNAQQGDDYRADTIVLLRVREGNAGYLDPAGNPVPETLFYGQGEAVLVHGDRALPCRWSKTNRKTQLRLTGSHGSAAVPRGNVFIELVPTKGKVTLTR